MKEPTRILNIVTVDMSCIFFRGALAFLNKSGFETALCSSPGKRLHEVATAENAKAFEVSMQREISPLRDLVSLWKLYRLIRSYRPTIVNASTPKAGLLGMLAARLAGVPVRVYLLRGLRLETARGAKRFVLGITERLASACASVVVCECGSLRKTYVDRGLVRPEKAIVLGEGSCNGFDTDRFRVDASQKKQSQELRSQLGIPTDEPVIGFIGRLTRDKGIAELGQAFERTLAVFPNAWLLLVGEYESGDAVREEIIEKLESCPRVIKIGFVNEPKPYYALMDVLAFPTHREGFGAVAAEASAMETPVVGFRVTGVVDAVQDGVTGTLVPTGDAEAFATALMNYLGDPQLRSAHGKAGRERMLKCFRPETVWQSWRELYLQLAKEQGVAP